MSEMILDLSFYLYKRGNKLIFYIRTILGMGSGGYIYLCYPSCTRVLKSEKTQTHIQTQLKRKTPSNWIWFRQISTCMGLVVMLMI